jgi:anti-anti-sigma factor
LSEIKRNIPVQPPAKTRKIINGELTRFTDFRLTINHSLTSATVIELHGELDLATAPALTEALDFRLLSGIPQLVVDLSRVTFLGAAGLSALVHAHRQAPRQTELLIEAGGNRKVLRVLAITELDRYLHMTAQQRETEISDA